MVIFAEKKRKAREALHKMTWREKDKKTEEILVPLGLFYDKRRDIICELMNDKSTEKSVGLSSGNGDCETIPFLYKHFWWKIHLEKGQYGVASGGKLTVEPENTQERLWVGFALRRYGKILFIQKGYESKITGFLLGNWSRKKNLSMDVEITFPNMDMCDAFLEGLYNVGYTREKCRIIGNTVYFSFDKSQSARQEEKRKENRSWSQTAVQWSNRVHCKLFMRKTRCLKGTMDRLMYYKEIYPCLYASFLGQFGIKK